MNIMLLLTATASVAAAQPATVRPTAPVAHAVLPEAGPLSEAKAEYVFMLGACSRYYGPSDMAIMSSLAEASSERERGYLARAFEGGFNMTQAKANRPTLAYCRERLAALAARLR